MKENVSFTNAREIMTEFAMLTGLSPTGRVPPQRYLWTDAFAVCNFLGLYRRTKDEKVRDLALGLVEQVHNILGRHREDDPRTGWISGLHEREGKMHPTKGGLRIGKELNERRPTDIFDERLEWDRDGQYYHYLTKWMHTLNCVSRVTGTPTYNRWAIELAKTAHARFTYLPSSSDEKRMHWKMSIDLSYPLVPSMGHHDPLDGFITYNQLKATAAIDPENSTRPELSPEITDMAHICEGKSWATDDPLGIGGLLSDAYRAAQLIVNGNLEQTDLPEILLNAGMEGLGFYAASSQWKLPADDRLAFRELGLSIGLRAVGKLQELISRYPGIFNKMDSLHSKIESLMQYAPLIKIIEMFWLEPKNREAQSWMEHRNINMVMLATSLAPDGYLTLNYFKPGTPI
ncbi:MAG: hypothetical protein ABII26_05710 [Pseudomonadota bacterium]